MQVKSNRSSGIGERLVDLADGRRILADVAGAGRDRAIHPDTFFVGAVPLSPPVALRRLYRHAVVIADDIGQRCSPSGPV